ncbi:transposase [Rhizobium sp. KVB221]|uniref:Transposase n=1 Tax=Rhizobium setariae TaxID=2801340 RepID=A0A936YLG0_9HYPH|nr:transposase [Rhizobium setariae]
MKDDDSGDISSPRSLTILQNNNNAFRVVDQMRWPDSKHCPRCDSIYIKTVNTAIFRELYRCVDCGYMFNSFSGTLFHGTKIPIVKYFQFFVLYGALGKKLSPRDVSYAISVSNKTAVSLIGRVEKLKTTIAFAEIDRDKAAWLKANSPEQEQNSEFENFFSYCETKSIIVSTSNFHQYLQAVIREKYYE